MGNKFYCVDRTENNLVVLQDDLQNSIYIDVSEFSEKVSRGDVVYLRGKCYIIDENETELRKQTVIKLQNKLLNKNKKEG